MRGVIPELHSGGSSTASSHCHGVLIRWLWHRLATELNLSRIPDTFADERAERESHNRTRMWLMSFIMDRCLSIQSGKAWMVQEDSVRVVDTVLTFMSAVTDPRPRPSVTSPHGCATTSIITSATAI